MSGKIHQYTTFCFAIPAVDDSKIGLYLPERLPVQFARAVALEAVAIGAEDDHVRELVLFDPGPIVYVLNRKRCDNTAGRYSATITSFDEERALEISWDRRPVSGHGESVVPLGATLQLDRAGRRRWKSAAEAPAGGTCAIAGL